VAVGIPFQASLKLRKNDQKWASARRQTIKMHVDNPAPDYVYAQKCATRRTGMVH
jgi:hypothetical protein